MCVWRHRTAKKNPCDDPFQTVPGSIPGSCIPAFTGTRNILVIQLFGLSTKLMCCVCISGNSHQKGESKSSLS